MSKRQAERIEALEKKVEELQSAILALALRPPAAPLLGTAPTPVSPFSPTPWPTQLLPWTGDPISPNITVSGTSTSSKNQ